MSNSYSNGALAPATPAVCKKGPATPPPIGPYSPPNLWVSMRIVWWKPSPPKLWNYLLPHISKGPGPTYINQRSESEPGHLYTFYCQTRIQEATKTINLNAFWSDAVTHESIAIDLFNWSPDKFMPLKVVEYPKQALPPPFGPIHMKLSVFDCSV